jgi:membrane protein DedA with SNARE-associated domain
LSGSIALRAAPTSRVNVVTWLGIALAAAALLLAVRWLGDSILGQTLLLLISTLASEDLTCIAAGQLVRRGDVDLLTAISGCTLGIFVGDMGLWLAGRALARFKPALVNRVNVLRQTIQTRNTAALVFAARFVPGLRLPMYLAMGAGSVDPVRFALLALAAAIVWTPLLVLLVAFAGDAVVRPLERYLGAGWLTLVLGLLTGLLILHIVSRLFTPIGRAKLVAGVSRFWRWEFWPSWVFYLPLLPWIGWLSLRHRGFLTVTAANPGIPHGGFVGESKFDILSSLRSPHVIPTMLVRGGIDALDRMLEQRRWPYPLVFKPDAGQRGDGVRLIHDRDAAAKYLQRRSGPVIVQPYHPGPFEAGIFYYRIPGENRGRIFSITDKHFSQVVGDGQSTLEQLIWRHPRYRMQASVFLARHAADAQRVLGVGEGFRLAMAGNHCQGTMFRDGAHLITPELEQAIDQIAQSIDGFFFGRFDVRYANEERFKAGQELTVIELNGVTSESTNLYDPGWSLWWAYRTLFRQWSILLQIGSANRQRGHVTSTYSSLLREVVSHYRKRSGNPLAD